MSRDSAPPGTRPRPTRVAVLFGACVLLALLGRALHSEAEEPTAPASYATDASPLSLEEKIRAGKRRFGEPWSLRNDIDGVWGLGPTFNEASCPACHEDASRSVAPADGAEIQRGMIVRLSLPGRTPEGGPLPHPHYGEQLQNRAIAARIPREGRPFVRYDAVDMTLADGEVVVLRRPRLEVRDLQFGPLGENVQISLRNAPPLHGLGLLEAVPDSTLRELARHQTEASRVSGRPNIVWNVESGRPQLGRFGWKANQPTLRQQIAAALLNDIGATSTLFPVDNCPPIQTACRTDPTTTNCGGLNGGCVGNLLEEVLPSRLDTMTLYLQALSPPPRLAASEALVRQGEAAFTRAGCDLCHVPSLRTGPETPIPTNADTVIHPFTDLLLHDMGDELADGRPDHEASGHEWRTAPLWGIGWLRQKKGHGDLLHDGRARNVTEAVLWHGGEAATARDAFRRMSRGDREALVAFVETR